MRSCVRACVCGWVGGCVGVGVGGWLIGCGGVSVCGGGGGVVAWVWGWVLVGG